MSAFIPGPRSKIGATASGALDGLRFAVKDLIDVAGTTTGGGNPDWLATHDPASRHAPCVAKLLAAGACIDGKTITDELAYSLEGVNAHYGTPLNPRWPHALPGGSSSGSASAVANGDVDFALGTDTGGSVRVPAAFCGLWGIRPTYDAVPLEGVLPFAPRFDTVGWFARTGEMLARVAGVLLDGTPAVDAPSALVRCQEAFDARAANEPDDAQRLRDLCLTPDAIEVFAGEQSRWLHVYQQLQDDSIGASLGAWIDANAPRFGPDIAARFARLKTHDTAEVERCRVMREAFAQRIDGIVGDVLIVLPTTPRSLLSKQEKPEIVDAFYRDALTMNAIAAFAGLPQVSVPVVSENERPLALSLIGPHGSDRALIARARDLFPSLP
ncbi:amidase [Paraburkholderia sp. Tr-20389]|uniref:amidase n=1 Tax=Paraburkholderia sp. Tr-20389 TaxID=2703903 RepID=UPI0019819216|nr:amidase [Paraburkholderia sp. Tr-20389]MBN3751526.1 amidase [Paraburkholderia sp. Tr-20389]